MARLLTHLQTMALAVATLWPGPLLAQASCTAVAQAVLALDPPAGWRGPWFSPVRALDKASGGLVVVDSEGWRAETKQAGLARLRELDAAPSLREAIGSLTGDTWLFSLHRFGRSSLQIAEVVQGTASCQRFVFFNDATLVAPPPIAQMGGDMAFCWTRTAYAGEIAGTPAFIVQDDRDQTVVLSITPRRDGQWQQSCQVVIKFDSVFEVTDRFCEIVDCIAVANQAFTLVKQIDRGSAPADGEIENFRMLQKLAEEDPPSNQLPTFGGTFDNAFREFAPESVMAPIVVAGETYLGRVGHAAFAWRISPDYLVALYKKQGDRLEPVAGLYVSKTRGKPLSATVE
jgi:hypothetical protein